MKVRHLIMLILFLFGLGAITYEISFALFASNASNNGNSFTAASEFPITSPVTFATPPPPPTSPIIAQTGDVVINEVFQNTTNSNEWVELFNKSASPIIVSGLTIGDNSGTDILPPTIPIPSGGFAVIVPNGTSIVVPNSAITIHLSTGDIGSGLNSTGGDRVVLTATSSAVIDQMSYGTDITAFNPATPVPPAGQSLARIPNGVDTNAAADWSLDSTPTIGVINSL